MPENKPAVQSEFRPCGEVRITATVETTVPLSENDIFNWMTSCSDPDALDRLSKYAATCARAMRHPDGDDFRSRA